MARDCAKFAASFWIGKWIFVALQLKSGLVFEVSKSHTHTQPIRLLCTSDQPVTEAATYKTPNILKSRKFIPPAAFEPVIPAVKRLQTNYLDRAPIACPEGLLSLTLRRSRTGTVWFYTSTTNKRAARPKLYTKLLIRDLKLMYSRLTLVRISINL